MDATLRSILLGRARRGFAALALGTAALSSGCLLSEYKIVHEPRVADAAKAQPATAAAAPAPPAPVPYPQGAPVAPQGALPKNACTYWNNHLMEANDPTRGGQPTPGIVGRLVLLGDNEQPTIYEGKVHIELWNDQQP